MEATAMNDTLAPKDDAKFQKESAPATQKESAPATQKESAPATQKEEPFFPRKTRHILTCGLHFVLAVAYCVTLFVVLLEPLHRAVRLMAFNVGALPLAYLLMDFTTSHGMRLLLRAQGVCAWCSQYDVGLSVWAGLFGAMYTALFLWHYCVSLDKWDVAENKAIWNRR